MFLTDYNEEETMEMFKKEFYEDGVKDGFMKGEQAGFDAGRKELILSMLTKTEDINLVSELTGMSAEEISSLKNEE